MRIASLLLPFFMLAALPFAAQADQRCEHSAPRDAELNLSGIKTVKLDIGPHTLTLSGSKNQGGSISGKACASDTKRLAELVVSQQRDGDKLIVSAERNSLMRKGSWSGKDYGYLTLTVMIPDTIPVQVEVGSGHAVVDSVASLSSDVGSGDLEARHVRGTFYADVGAGDIRASDVGALHVVAIGSGGLGARDVRGASWVGEVNSGDLRIVNAKGNVEIGSIGSGGATLSDITGSVVVKSVGSGGLEANGIAGDLLVDRVGSGSVRHRDVSGKVSIPSDD